MAGLLGGIDAYFPTSPALLVVAGLVTGLATRLGNGDRGFQTTIKKPQSEDCGFDLATDSGQTLTVCGITQTGRIWVACMPFWPRAGTNSTR